MNEPQSFSVQQASDPRTPGQVLADIAALRADLRPAVAANPATYPGLLTWLGGLGDPAVDAALRARQQGTSGQGSPWAAPSPYAGGPTVPSAPPVPYAPWSQGQTAPGGGGSGTTYGYQQPIDVPGRTPGSRSTKVLWIVLGAVLGVLVLGVMAVVVVRGLSTSLHPDAYGSDTDLDTLYERCLDEDWAACDQLYFEAPSGSDYEEFADTCGHRTDGGTYCVDELG